MVRKTPHNQSSQHQPIQHSTYICPSCGVRSRFLYIGEQHWPEAIARRRGVASISLWECGACGSSVDGVRLSPAEDASAGNG